MTTRGSGTVPVSATIPAMDLTSLLGPRPALFDGALGTQLLLSGFDAERDLLGTGGPQALALTRNEQVRAVHESYLDAGARLIATNTFCATPDDLARQGIGARFETCVDAAVAAAREAVDAWRDEVPDARVLGSIGPGLAPRETEVDARAKDATALAERLLERGVDALLLETQIRLDHLGAVVERVAPLARAHGAPLVASVAFGPDGTLACGADASAVARWASGAPIDLLATNCGRGPETTAADLERLRAHWDGPLAALPTAGLPERDDDLASYPIDARAFADAVAPWIERFDLVGVGGCCGTSPRHLAELASALGIERPWIEPEDDADEHEDDDESQGGEA